MHYELRHMRLAISQTHGSCVELFPLVDWAHVCGINLGHSAGRLILQGDVGPVTSIWLAAAIGAVVVGGEVRCGLTHWRAKNAPFSLI